MEDTRQAQLNEFNAVIGKHFKDYQKKMKQWCFLNKLDYEEDQLNNTYLRVADKILKNGINAKTEQDYLNYYFKAFKFNTFQQYLFKKKKPRPLDALTDVDIADEVSDEDNFAIIAKHIIDQAVKDKFDSLTYSIFRLRFLLELNGRNLTLKEIKEMTGQRDARARLSKVLLFLRENYSIETLKKIIKSY